jgi:glycosyltransferase involved in cell wall biosynthesis
MLIAEAYDTKEFADKMNYVVKNREEAENIGRNGKEFAFKNFKYELFGKRITDFLISIPV